MSTVNLQGMVELVFSEPPKPANSYLLDLQIKKEEYPDKTAADLVEMEAANIAQMLMGIFSYGCSVLYKSVVASEMTKEQFDKVNEYMKSFGYTAKYDYVYEDKMVDNKQTKVATNLNIWFERLN